MSGVYAVARQRMATGAFNWPAGTFKVCLVGPDYTPDYDSDATLADVPEVVRVSDLMAVANPTAALGYCSADDVAVPSLVTSGIITGVVIVQVSGGDPEAYPLVAHLSEGVGFGVTATGGAAAIEWDSQGIFRP